MLEGMVTIAMRNSMFHARDSPESWQRILRKRPCPRHSLRNSWQHSRGPCILLFPLTLICWCIFVVRMKLAFELVNFINIIEIVSCYYLAARKTNLPVYPSNRSNSSFRICCNNCTFGGFWTILQAKNASRAISELSQIAPSYLLCCHDQSWSCS